VSEQPIYEQVAADLADDPLADCPEPGPLRPEDEPRLFDAVTLPTLAGGDTEDDEPEACHGCGDTPHHLSSGGYCDGCVAVGQDEAAAS
jgi:hypothetical protein